MPTGMSGTSARTRRSWRMGRWSAPKAPGKRASMERWQGSSCGQIRQLTSGSSTGRNFLAASRIVWASGAGGTFLLTLDGGRTWRAGVVPGADSLQFRDVEGVSAKVAYLLSIGPGSESRIYKTSDGGQQWSLQFQNQNPKAFYDGFDFW